MTPTDTQSLALFILIGTGIAACLGDFITTQKGFDYGLTEKWRLTRFLMKKLGDAGACAAGTALFIFSAGGLAAFSLPVAIAFAASITGIEAFNTIRNYRKYTATPNYKNGIRVKRDPNLQP